MPVKTRPSLSGLPRPRPSRSSSCATRCARKPAAVVSSSATLRDAELVLSGAGLARLSSRHDVETLLEELRTRTVQAEGRAAPNIRLKDQGDLRLVEAAVAGGAGYLVTADRELLLQRGYESTEFVTPGELLKAMDGGGAAKDE